MILWLRPEDILAIITSLYYCSVLVSGKTYDKFLCATEEGHHQLSCPDERALLTDISIRKVYRRTQMCQPDEHSDYLVHCQAFVDGSKCEGNQSCSIEISSRDYLQCGEKTYLPTYFFVKYTCTQIHTMCTDTAPIRNTLYGYIVSPAYPHPMGDNLKCSINIEADPSMFIEISPIEIHLQDAMKCRSEYLEIFGYDSPSDEQTNSRNINTIWKSYHTWCGNDQSGNHPLPRARYLIASNSLYMSLQTIVSRKTRFFKIRYKIVPSSARSQYNSDGIAFGPAEHRPMSMEMSGFSSTPVVSTSLILPSVNSSEMKHLNGTQTKRPIRKEIIIGIVAGVILLLVAIIVGILVFVLIRKRRSSTSAGKKNAPPSTTVSNPASKSVGKSSDKAPLLEQTNNAASAATKRKLVPERTVQVTDVNTSRFKPNETAAPVPGKSGSINAENPSTKSLLTAADSGIYGADLTEEAANPIKTTAVDASKPVTSTPSDPPATTTIVVNPLSEISSIAALVETEPTETNAHAAAPNTEANGDIVLPFDSTIQSAYPGLIDATTSENEGTVCGSALQSRRTSTRKPSLVTPDSMSVEPSFLPEKISASSVPHHIPFNPLHVILKKDANKYYTTEYI